MITLPRHHRLTIIEPRAATDRSPTDPYLRWFWMIVAAPWRLKRKALPRCCHYQVSPHFELNITISL
jgi:hypothetical protein